MNLLIKDFDVEMVPKNKGISIQVRDTKGKFLGNLIIDKKRVEWCQGKKRRGNGTSKKWEELIDAFSA